MMKRREFAMAALTGAACGSAVALDTGIPAPKFKAKSLDGELFTNESVMGKVVLVQLWTTWCGYCRRDQPAVDEVAGEFGSQGLIVLAVNIGESRSKVKEYLDDNPRKVKIVLTGDTNLGAMFGDGGYPRYVVINRKGKVVREQTGSGGALALRDMLSTAGLSSKRG